MPGGRKLTAAHLLGDHDDTRSLSGTPDPGNGEQLEEAREEVALGRQPGLLDENVLVDELGVDEVQIPGGLQGRVPQLQETLVCLSDTALLQQPAGALRREPDAQDQRHGGDERAPQLQAPGDRAGVDDGQVRGEADEDPERGPQLPRHDEGTADGSRSVLGREDGDRDFFQTHADTEEETRDEQLLPGVGEAGADRGDEREDGADEDDGAAAEEVVQRVGDPAGAVRRGRMSQLVGRDGWVDGWMDGWAWG